MKLILRYIAGFVLFLITFIGSIQVRDCLYESWIKSQVRQVETGMARHEVIKILGRPTSYHMSDEPGTYWCYGSNSFNSYEEYCGKVMLLMGSDNRVIRVGEILP